MKRLDTSISLPEVMRQKMELAGLPSLIRGIVRPTMEMVVGRYWDNKDSPGWIDMKFDPADGKERDASREFYRKDRVYGWIQGRGLESLTGHLRWIAAMPGYHILEKEKLISTAESLYRNIMTVCFSSDRLDAYFVMGPQGNSVGPGFGEGPVTLSHLFVLRGLMAYAGYRGYSADLTKIVTALRNVVDASIRGECLDDQIAFGENGGEDFSAARKGYEGQMISIGACELLFAHTRAEEDMARGVEAIGSVLAKHIGKTSLAGPIMLDAFDGEGLPARDNGHLTTNPGHTLEFVGLALQFFRHAAAVAGKPELMTGWSDMIGTLRALALRYNTMGRAPHGGIVRSVDAETGRIINGNCPWWSSFEAVRTFAELYMVERDEGGKRYCIDQMKSYLDCIKDVYLKPSSIGIPVQTVSIRGEVVPIIPATPDIDAGYHTGMPLIDAYEIMGNDGTMLCGSAEANIPAYLGHRLQGHIARTEPADREMDPLYIRCCWFATASTQALLLSADVLEFSHEWSEAFAGAIATTYGIPEENIFLLATHTHTAPCAIDLGTLKSDTLFLASLEKTMRDTIIAASNNISPSIGALCASTIEGVGINRRYRDPATEKVSMRPNYAGENDNELSGFFLFDADGKLKTILVNMAVHPTTLGVSVHEVSADYPGRAAARIKEIFGPAVVALPIQGACGDIRPMVLDDAKTDFAEGTERDIDRIGAVISESLSRAFADMVKNKIDWIDGSRLEVSTRDVDLAFASLPTYEELGLLSARLTDEIGQLKTASEREKG
ncbi:MAG TPA: hypothetical protein VN437_02760, partial [Rectinemataceae bacterium]|nr:hypothetical protein [Rectinemataceae bacterium]